MKSEGDKVIFIVCGESKKYDTNHSDLLARAIHLKPQNLSFLNSWLVIVLVVVCLCFCVFVSVCLFDDGKHYRVVCCWCHSVKVILLISVCLFNYVNVNILMLLC